MSTISLETASAAVQQTHQELTQAKDHESAARADIARLNRVLSSPESNAAAVLGEIQDAETRLALALRLQSVLADRLSVQQANQHRAFVEQFRPLFDRGVAGRIAACEKREVGLAIIKEAEAEHAKASALIESAHRSHFPRQPGAELMHGPMLSAAEERAMWEGKRQ